MKFQGECCQGVDILVALCMSAWIEIAVIVVSLRHCLDRTLYRVRGLKYFGNFLAIS
ncbi:hypothetical protein ACQKFM_13315 [Paenibacillus xylanexedens]|uniref:hypothetical protein n=1 Tax=Paenibacillus xylanexedens TaxID=528191 RepID=UPI003D032A42